MRPKPIHRIFFSAAVLALALCVAACGDDAKEPANGSSGTDSSRGTGQASGTAAKPGPDGIDTTDGTLTIKGSELEEGTWTLKDVTAYTDQHARAGTTLYELSVEGHDGDADNHFRIRLYREGSPIDVGTYDLNGTDRKLEARWEHGGAMYSSRVRGTGTVELTEVDDAHAEGSFTLRLGMAERDSVLQKITGKFNQRLNK